MNTAAKVDSMIADWTAKGETKAQIATNTAEACLGWSYVYGAAGQKCTPSVRRSYINNYATRNPAESAQIKKTCQVCNGSKSSCDGCKFYPGGETRCFDCRGFTRWILQQVGLSLQGGGATSQWNDKTNWSQKGIIADIPSGVVCCVFMANGSKMSHTGLYIGNGDIIHCSGTVKRGKITDKGWSHFAVPVGLNDDTPMPQDPPTIRKGSRGVWVTLAQEKLIERGYSCGAKGADGIFGKDTESAVRAFQRASGLNVDGVVGHDTWDALLNGAIDYYTVTVPHLTLSQADALIAQYPGSEKTQEGGEG